MHYLGILSSNYGFSVGDRWICLAVDLECHKMDTLSFNYGFSVGDRWSCSAVDLECHKKDTYHDIVHTLSCNYDIVEGLK